jgi:hypothetical protein
MPLHHTLIVLLLPLSLLLLLLLLATGVFDWLQQQGRLAALIRQISNPMAGVDTTLLSLAGTGFSSRRAFGFMSCERVVGAAEGMNVLRVSRVFELLWSYMHVSASAACMLKS